MGRICKDGGQEALDKFAETNPVEYLGALEALYIIQGDDEGLEKFRAATSEAIRKAIQDGLTRNGFAGWEKAEQIAREQGEEALADRIAAHILHQRN